MIRNIAAVVLGLIVGVVVNMVFITIQTGMYPMPEVMPERGTDEYIEKYNEYLATLPAMAFVVVMVAHLGQAFVGGWVAARVGQSRPMLLSMIIGVLSLAGGIIAMTMFEGPGWMKIELPLYLVVAWVAGNMVVKSRAAKGT